MNQNSELTDSNFLLYCAKVYDNPQCHDVEEFLEDVRRIKYIKKLFTRYEKTGELKERLILNHIIIMTNVFGRHHVVRILFLKIDNYLHYLKPFLIFLDLLPEKVYNIGADNRNFITDEITMDPKIIEVLRENAKLGNQKS